METEKWFDENEKEIIREPVKDENLECIAELGGNFEEFNVGINFYSKNIDREEITNLLEHNPTKAWNAGERHPIGNSGKTRITDWGKWLLWAGRNATDVNIKLRNLFKDLTDDLDKWQKLTSKYESWVEVAGYMDNWNRGFMLDADILKLLSDRNLKIYFDIYYYEDEDKDE